MNPSSFNRNKSSLRDSSSSSINDLDENKSFANLHQSNFYSSTNSIASSRSSSSRYFGDITLEMIDDFLNPASKTKDSKLIHEVKFLPASTTQGFGNIDMNDPEYYDQSVHSSMSSVHSTPANYSNFFQRTQRALEPDEFSYVEKYRREYEEKLMTEAEQRSEIASVVGSQSSYNRKTEPRHRVDQEDAESIATDSVADSRLSKLESVSEFQGSNALKKEMKRQAEHLTRVNENEDDMIDYNNNMVLQDIINDRPVEVEITDDERRNQLLKHLVNNYKFLDAYNPKLPITKMRERILDGIDSYKFSIIHGGTGCGKTTQVPQYILDQHIRENKYCNIIVTQPRRIAATSIAKRVCSERSWDLGGICGFQIGLDRSKVSEDTRITYVTTGVLLQKLIAPGFEENFNRKYTHIILDEVHERDLDTDFCLLVLKLKNFKNLKAKIVLMSATIDPNSFVDYFTPPMSSMMKGQRMKPPVQEIQARTYKVSKFYWQDLVDTNGFLNKTLTRCYNEKVERIRQTNGYSEETFYTRGMSYSRSVGKRASEKYMGYEADKNGIYSYRTFTNRLQNLEFKADEPVMSEETMIMVINLLKYFDDQDICEIKKRPDYVEMNDNFDEEEDGNSSLGPNPNSKKSGPRIIGKFAEIRNSVLIFVPGMFYIQKLQELISKELPDNNLIILPLHSDIVSEQQQLVFEKPRATYRKVIIATSIAESSITVPDVKYVIDFGLTKELYCDPYTNYTHLRLEWASRSSMEQRCGRAGRVSEGVCFRLLPREFFESFVEYTIPAILREPLSQVVLNVKRLGQSASPICVLAMALTAPKLSDVERTILKLKEVGALTLYTRDENGLLKNNPHDGDLTYVGRIMASLPVDVRLTKLILLGHTFGKLKEAIIIAAALSNKTFFTCYFKAHIESFTSKWRWAQGWMCDFILILNAFKVYEQIKERGVMERRKDYFDWAKKNMIEMKRLEEVDKLKNELESRLRDLGITCNRHVKVNITQAEEGKYNIDDEEDITNNNLILKMIIAGAFYPNYFSAPKIDIQEALKNVSGRSLHDTVQIKNLPMNEGILYNQKITELFRQCSNRIQIHYEDSKAYIEFKGKLDEEPTNVNFGVYLAVQMRLLRLPMKLQRFNPRVTQDKLKKIQQLRQNNSNILVTLDSSRVGALKFNKIEEKKKPVAQANLDSDESDTDTIKSEGEDTATIGETDDEEEIRHHDFISPKDRKGPMPTKYLSLLSLESSGNNLNSSSLHGSQLLSTPSPLSKQAWPVSKTQSLRQLNSNRLTTCENTFAEYLSNPRYLLPPEVDQGKLIDIEITETVECGHFWVQIKDKSHQEVAMFIYQTLNTPAYSLKPLSPNEIKENNLCVAYFENILYRARILYVSKEDKTISIQYVDYGNKEKKRFSDVFQLSDELQEYPFQALECTLDNIKPSLIKNPNGTWTHQAHKMFKSIIDEKDTKFKIKVNYLIDERAIVDLQAVGPIANLDIGEYLRKSGYAEQCDKSDKSFYASRSNFCSQEIMYVPYRESDYVSKKPEYVNSAEIRGPIKRLGNREHEEDTLSSVADSGTDRPISSFVDEDVNSYSGEFSINGPYSPLEVNFFALPNAGHSRKVRIERDSINFAAIDDDPINEASRLMIASDISLNASGNGMVLRKTCFMPKYPGLLGICCLLFAPTCEMRLDDNEMFYTGAICGLGYDDERKMPIYTDNDIECVFDARLNMKDLGLINSVRMAINMVIGDEDETKTWSSEERSLRKLQQAACNKLLGLIQRNREIVEPIHFKKPGKWNQVDPRRLIVANPQGAELEQLEKKNAKIYYTYHKAVALGEIVAR